MNLRLIFSIEFTKLGEYVNYLAHGSELMCSVRLSVCVMRCDRYKRHDSLDDWRSLRVHPDGATSVTVHSLVPDTTYQFMPVSTSRCSHVNQYCCCVLGLHLYMYR